MPLFGLSNLTSFIEKNPHDCTPQTEREESMAFTVRVKKYIGVH